MKLPSRALGPNSHKTPWPRRNAPATSTSARTMEISRISIGTARAQDAKRLMRASPGVANSSIMTAMNFDKWRHYLRARRSEIFGKTDDAIRDYRVALQADPGFRKAANALAYCYAQAGRHAEAIRYFEHAARLGRPDATVHYNLGYSYEKNREPRKAIESFRAAVGLNPSLDRAWYGMGLAHAVLGEHREAMEAFGQA